MSFLNDFLICNASLLLFYSIYHLLLRSETHFQFNRTYLLFALIFSMLLPLLALPAGNYLNAASIPIIELNPITVNPSGETAAQFSWMQFLLWIYWGVVAFLALRFITGLGHIFRLALQNKKIQHDGFILVHTEQNGIFSFFHFLFWNDKLVDEQSAPQILAHEQTHILQWHSLDILLAEVIRIICWFNPAAWGLQRSIRLNHEYLADERATRTEKMNAQNYGQILLAQVFQVNPSSLENHFFNHSLTQKRLAMLTQKRSKNTSKWKYLLVLPLILTGLYLSSCTEKPEEVEKTVEVEKSLDEAMEKPVDAEKPYFPGGTEAMMEYVLSNLKYPETAKAEGVEGTTFVKFKVNESGKVVDASVQKGFHEACDAEALRVVKNMPNWNMPASETGEKFKIELVLPVKFVLDPEETS